MSLDLFIAFWRFNATPLFPSSSVVYFFRSMTDQTAPQPLPWTRTRYGFAAFWCIFLVVAWFVLRAVLYCAFKPSGLHAAIVLHAFLSGFHRDLFVAIVQTLPLLAWFLVIPNHKFSARWHRILFFGIT